MSSSHMKRVDNKGQIFGLSFQMIFSILLIIVFVIAAGIAVRTLINNTEHARIVKFIQELNSETEKIWMATTAEKTIYLDLPSKIGFVCFADNLKSLDEEDFPDKDVYDSINFYSDEYGDSKVFFYDPDVLESYDMTPYTKISCGSKKKDCLSLESVDKICCIKNKKGITLTLRKDIESPNVILASDNCIR